MFDLHLVSGQMVCYTAPLFQQFLTRKCNSFLFTNHMEVVQMCHCRITCDKCMCNTSHYMNVDCSTPASYTFEKCEQFVVEVHEYWWATTNFGWNTNDFSVPMFTCFSQFNVIFLFKIFNGTLFQVGKILKKMFSGFLLAIFSSILSNFCSHFTRIMSIQLSFSILPVAGLTVEGFTRSITFDTTFWYSCCPCPDSKALRK